MEPELDSQDQAISDSKGGVGRFAVWNAYRRRLIRHLDAPMREKREKRPGAKTQRGVTYVFFFSSFGAFFIAVGLDWATPDDVSGAAVGIAAFLVYVAALAVGAALGFLFGLPRSRVAETVAQGDTSGASSLPSSKRYLSNSNLIKVSDWLTTIVVGLTLVNLETLVPAIRNLGAVLYEPLGGQAYSAIAGVCITIFGVIVGFMLAFLWVSIRVRELMEAAERDERESETEVVPEFEGLSVREAIEAAVPVRVTLEVPPRAGVGQKVSSQNPPPGSRVVTNAKVAVSVDEPGNE